MQEPDENYLEDDNKESTMGYYTVITPNVLYDKNLTDGDKILYALITGLTRKEGYCYAGNVYLARLINKKERAVQNSINRLIKAGHLLRQIKHGNNRMLILNLPGINLVKKTPGRTMHKLRLTPHQNSPTMHQNAPVYINNKVDNKSICVLKKQHTQFLEPSLQEIKSYCLERKNNINPESFFNYHVAFGWKGVVDWRAKIHLWETYPQKQKAVINKPTKNEALSAISEWEKEFEREQRKETT